MSFQDIAKALKPKRTFTPEWREKLAEAMRRRWADPAYREAQTAKIMTTKRSTAGRKRHSAKLSRFHADPERGLRTRAQALRTRIAKMQKQLAAWDKLLGND